ARLAARAREAPLDPGLPLAELLPRAPWAGAVLPLLGVERRGAKGYLPGVSASLGARARAAQELERALAESGLDPMRVEDRELGAYLETEGRLVRLGDGQAVGAEAFETARRALVEECGREGRITLARFRDLLGASRRTAQLLLERFDADGLTRRVGDERVLRRSAARRREG
ncbi:MAG: SelB C-terminal domain-containing protein, partial [Actinobacteria bacterium]|nr:SelB C-terminal domain-containing protein [Actinomycetota bacterium]